MFQELSDFIVCYMTELPLTFVHHESHVDQKNKVVTTPAFMCETKLHLIFDGIGAMVRDVLKLTGKWSYIEQLVVKYIVSVSDKIVRHY